MNIQLSNVEILMLALAVLAIWTVWGTANMMRTMGQGGNPNTPQAALGQAAITGTIGCLTMLVVALSLAGAAYLFVRRPSLPLPGISVRLVAPEGPRTALAYPSLAPGSQAQVVVEPWLSMYEADAAGKPTEQLKTYLWPEQTVKVVGGPADLNGRVMWRVQTQDGTEGWAPALAPTGRVALAPR